MTDIVNGKVNSIMRLVLALAAHYKPNNVRESRHRPSLASYAQVNSFSLSVFVMVNKSHLFIIHYVVIYYKKYYLLYSTAAIFYLF